MLDEARRWQPDQPFPLLPGPALERYLAVSGGDLPPVVVTPRSGVVLSTGDETGRAAGRLLAVATDRPHRHVTVDTLVSEVAGIEGPVAIVGPARDIAETADWPAVGNPLAGVISARTTASLITLVYRTLLPEAHVENSTFVVANSFHSQDLSADAVELDELDELYKRRHRLVVYHLHGRECSVGLPDGVICGRTDGGLVPLGPLVPHRPLPDDTRIPSCLRGEGCFRADLEEDQRVQAADLNGLIVFAQSCGAVSAGVSAYPEEVGIGGGFLEGTAVAVIGGMGSHSAEVGAERQVANGLRQGLPLGEIVAGLNATLDGSRGGLARFGLLGDPGLSLTPEADATGRPVSTVRPPVDETALETLHHLNDHVLPGIERLAWLEVDLEQEPLTAARSRVRALAGEPDQPRLADEVARLADEVAALQFDLVSRTAAMVQREGADFLGDASPAFERLSRSDVPCPSCRTDRGQHLTMRHAVEHQLSVQTLQCRRCGDVWWSTEPTAATENGRPSLSIGGPVDFDADRRGVTSLERVLTNDGERPVRGGVALAFRAFYDPPVLPTWQSEPVTIPAGGSHTFRVPIEMPGPGARPDVHTGFVFAVLDGVYLMAPLILRLS
ncbi:hypothetical protein [Streptomyces sp. NPDC127033]|uniref:hypothetical protein n=1 Tax=Streptomyces sp. NPDC127033 TaxID=3347110 RepID=UPI0036472159